MDIKKYIGEATENDKKQEVQTYKRSLILQAEGMYVSRF